MLSNCPRFKAFHVFCRLMLSPFQCPAYVSNASALSMPASPRYDDSLEIAIDYFYIPKITNSLRVKERLPWLSYLFVHPDGIVASHIGCTGSVRKVNHPLPASKCPCLFNSPLLCQRSTRRSAVISCPGTGRVTASVLTTTDEVKIKLRGRRIRGSAWMTKDVFSVVSVPLGDFIHIKSLAFDFSILRAARRYSSCSYITAWHNNYDSVVSRCFEGTSELKFPCLLLGKFTWPLTAL